MLSFLVRRKIRSTEKQLGESMDYLRHMYQHAPGAFWQFVKVAKAAGYREKLPAAPFYVACIVALRSQDCGPCVQISVNAAKQAGVPSDILKATLAGNVGALPESLGDVYRFAEAVATGSGDEEQYRVRLHKVFGEEALVELAMAIALAQTFPVLKRGLGFAKSCSLVKVEV